MERLLIIGGSSLLGSKLLDAADQNGNEEKCFASINKNIYGRFAEKTDIGRTEEVQRLFDKVRPDVVICTAALTNADECEKNPDNAKRINADGPKNISLCCKRYRAKLIHVSTDYVFDGEKEGRYKENDAPNPISVYGKTKLEGDENVLSILPDAIVARVAVLYGWNHAGPKDNFATWVIGKLRANQSVPLFEDQYNSPTFADNLAKTLLELSEKDVSGILNVSGPDCLNRPACGMIIAEIFNLNPSLIVPVPMASIALLAKRPKRSCLDVTKVESLLKRKTLSFKEGIMAMKEQEASIK